MGCLIVLAALLSPRLVIAILYLFTDRLTIAFDSFLLGFAGFLVLPWTTAIYALAYSPISGVSGFGWFLVVLGLLADLGSWFGGGQQAQSRRAA